MDTGKNIVLIQTRSRNNAIIPPWACIYLEAPLARLGYKVDIIDPAVDNEWRKRADQLIHKNTICAGVSTLTGECIKQGLEFSAIARRNSECPIVWGGPHCNTLPEETVKSSLVDYVIVGDGEIPIVSFIAGLCSGNLKKEEIPGLVYIGDNGEVKRNTQIVHKEMPEGSRMIPDGTSVPLGLYIQKNTFLGAERSLELLSSRGCPHTCQFCSSSGKKWRSYNVGEIMESLNFIKKKFDIDGCFFIDENFFVSKKRIREFSEELIRSKLNLKWGSNIRIDYFSKFDEAFIKLIYDSGCRFLEFGIESGDRDVLRQLEKNITFEQIKHCMEVLKKYPFSAIFNFMYGFPYESIDQVINTFSFILEIKKNNPRIIIRGPSFYTPYPGTKLFGETIRKGFKPPVMLEEWGEYNWSSRKTWMHSTNHEDIKARKLFYLYYKLANKCKWMFPVFNYRVKKYRSEQHIKSVEKFILKILGKFY